MKCPSVTDRQACPTGYLFSKSYLLHGIELRLECNAGHILELLHQILYPFTNPAANSIHPQLQFTLWEDDQIDPGCICGLEPVSFLGEVTYYNSGAGLFTHIPDKFLVQAHLERLTAAGRIHPDYSRNQWFIFHQVFYPILAELLKPLHIFNLHTAAVARQGQGILFPAQARSGKSTLSIKLMQSGFDFLSDDICFVTRDASGDLRLLGFPEPVQIWEETRKFFPDLAINFQSGDMCPNIKRAFRVEELFPQAVQPWASPRFLIIPRIVSAENSLLEPLGKSAALSKLIPQSLLVANRNIAGQHLKILTELVDQCDCYQLKTGADLNQVPRLINQLF